MFCLRYGIMAVGLPRLLSNKESACHYGGCRFDPWAGKIPWRRKWQPIPVFLPSPWDCKESNTTYQLNNNNDNSGSYYSEVFFFFLLIRMSSSISSILKTKTKWKNHFITVSVKLIKFLDSDFHLCSLCIIQDKLCSSPW